MSTNSLTCHYRYYVLVIASVFARKQVWVRKVCLVAALLFPAIAAIHGIALAVLHDDGKTLYLFCTVHI